MLRIVRARETILAAIKSRTFETLIAQHHRCALPDELSRWSPKDAFATRPGASVRRYVCPECECSWVGE